MEGSQKSTCEQILQKKTLNMLTQYATILLSKSAEREENSMKTEFTDTEVKLIWAMAIAMIPLVIDATIRMIQLG